MGLRTGTVSMTRIVYYYMAGDWPSDYWRGRNSPLAKPRLAALAANIPQSMKL